MAISIVLITATAVCASELGTRTQHTAHDADRMLFTGKFRYTIAPEPRQHTFNRNRFLPESAALTGSAVPASAPPHSSPESVQPKKAAALRLIEPKAPSAAKPRTSPNPHPPLPTNQGAQPRDVEPSATIKHAALPHPNPHAPQPSAIASSPNRLARQHPVIDRSHPHSDLELLDHDDLMRFEPAPSAVQPKLVLQKPLDVALIGRLLTTASIIPPSNNTLNDPFPRSKPGKAELPPIKDSHSDRETAESKADPETAVAVNTATASNSEEPTKPSITSNEATAENADPTPPIPSANPKRVAAARKKRWLARQRARSRRKRAQVSRAKKKQAKANSAPSRSNWARSVFTNVN